MKYCERDEFIAAGLTLLHPMEKGAVVTPEGIFCSKHCAGIAHRDALRENALEDRDSWYFLNDKGETHDRQIVT